MSHWSNYEQIMAGVKPAKIIDPKSVLVTCYRCGHKYNMKECVEVGNNVYKCINCINNK